MDNSFQFSESAIDFFILLGAIVLVCFIAFIWVTFFRKGGRAPKPRHLSSPKKPAGIKQFIKKDRRHIPEPQFPPNPTLAQTGGLPPIRDEKKPDAPTPPP